MAVPRSKGDRIAEAEQASLQLAEHATQIEICRSGWEPTFGKLVPSPLEARSLL